MMIRRLQSAPFADRARRCAREIALAAVLSLAALVFVVTAFLRGNAPETALVEPPAEARQQTGPLEPQHVDGPAPASESGWDPVTKDL